MYNCTYIIGSSAVLSYMVDMVHVNTILLSTPLHSAMMMINMGIYFCVCVEFVVLYRSVCQDHYNHSSPKSILHTSPS